MVTLHRVSWKTTLYITLAFPWIPEQRRFLVLSPKMKHQLLKEMQKATSTSKRFAYTATVTVVYDSGNIFSRLSWWTLRIVFAQLSSCNQSTYSGGRRGVDTYKKIRSFEQELIAHNLLVCLSEIDRTLSACCPRFAFSLNSYQMDVREKEKSTGLGSCQSCRLGSEKS